MEEITLQVPSLDPPFAIFIDRCSCDFEAGESINRYQTFGFIVVSLLLNFKLVYSLNYMCVTINFLVSFVCFVHYEMIK